MQPMVTFFPKPDRRAEGPALVPAYLPMYAATGLRLPGLYFAAYSALPARRSALLLAGWSARTVCPFPFDTDVIVTSIPN